MAGFLGRARSEGAGGSGGGECAKQSQFLRFWAGNGGRVKRQSQFWEAGQMGSMPIVEVGLQGCEVGCGLASMGWLSRGRCGAVGEAIE